MENLACYIVRASVSQERMVCIPHESKVVCKSKGGKNLKTFDALEWLAAMCSHVPNKGEQILPPDNGLYVAPVSPADLAA